MGDETVHDGRDLRAPCEAVGEADGVEDDSRRHRANNRVLDRRFVRLPRLAEPCKHVGREAHELPGNKKHQQVLRVGKEDHAEGCERQQAVVDRVRRALLEIEGSHGHRECDSHGDEGEHSA